MRFQAAPKGDSWSVWDAGTNSWRSDDDLTQAEAGTVAADLSLQFDRCGPRPSEHRSPFDPPVVATWTVPASLTGGYAIARRGWDEFRRQTVTWRWIAAQELRRAQG